MKLSFSSMLKLAFGLLQILGLLLLSGCVTAKMPAASAGGQLKTYPNGPKIAVAEFKDTRSSKKAGMIGLASISVQEADLKGAVTRYALDCLNQQLDVNVEKVSAEKPDDVRQLAVSRGVQGLLLGKITKLEVYAFDAAMGTTKAALQGEVWLYDAEGHELFHSALTGNYSEYLGFKEVQKATGRLVDATARAFAHEMGSKLHEQGILKNLK